MSRIACVVIILCAALLAPIGGPAAQTAEQREALDRYLETREKAGGKAEEQDSVYIFERSVPRVPPAREKTGGEPVESRRFGLDMFTHPPDEFISSTEIPVPSDYVLGPGDHIVINLWGGADLSHELVIDREGKVFIPRAGELVLWGMTLEAAEKRIEDLLKTIYSTFKMNMILGKIRSITVFVSGEVKRPGAYTTSSLYTLFNTLYLAGGPNERGTLRSIRLIRNNRIVKEVDLYRLLVEGVSEDVKLESNDVIFVPVVNPLVTVSGEVRRPAVYEILGGERLLDVIRIAGGVRSSAFLGNIDVRRFEDNERRVLVNLDISDIDEGDESNIKLRDGDVILVKTVHDLTERVVYVDGEVKYPGTYEYVDGMKVSDLIDPGMLLPFSYLKKALVTRTMPDRTIRIFSVDLEVVLGLSHRADGGQKRKGALFGDIEMRPMDRVRIFHADRMRDRENVHIAGEVRDPGRYEYAGNMTIGDLIFLAGGVKKQAYLLHADLARLSPDSTRVSVVQGISLLEVLERPYGPKDIPLDAGDAIFVREIPKSKDHEKVMIGGEVQFPGTYVLDRDRETLRNLIIRAGGFTVDAFPEGAVFTRQGIVDELRQRHVGDIIASLQPSYIDSAGLLQREMAAVDINPVKMNRIVIDLPRIVDKGDPEEDIFLQDRDRIFIPKIPSGVNVIGSVASSGTIKFRREKRARYYIERAGGFTMRASRGEVRVLKADGRVIKRNALSHRLELGDAVIVPERIRKDRNWLKMFQASLGIVASALTTVFILTKL